MRYGSLKTVSAFLLTTFTGIFMFAGCATTASINSESKAVITNIKRVSDLLIEDGQVINLMVVAPLNNIFYRFPEDGRDADPTWYKDTQRNMIANFERGFLESTPPGKGSVISQSSIEIAIEQLKIQATGLFDSETLSRIGQFVGANYVVELAFSRYRTFSTRTDHEIRKFIEVESSRILAVDQFVDEWDMTVKPERLMDSKTNGISIYLANDGEANHK